MNTPQKPAPKKNHHHHRGHHKPHTLKEGQSLKPSQNRFHKNHRRPFNRNPNANPNTNSNNFSYEKVFKRYDYLLEQHCIARRKYFENFYKTEGTQKEKSEKNFYSSLEELRNYLATLSPDQKEAFEKKYNSSPMDITYSENHSLPSQGERVRFADKFDDPHILKTQTEADFSKDTEESVGTLEDYKHYKGI